MPVSYMYRFSIVSRLSPSHVSQRWHDHGVMQVCKGGLKGSTEYVLEVSLMKILILDGVKHSPTLNFSVPLDWIPLGMYQVCSIHF